ncbi:MAG: tetratricopeptide repeat protein [Saprospiraceae bacterium]|nr:tetratricopeptide repeat protein [Candidatus Opimibacter skivensis]
MNMIQNIVPICFMIICSNVTGWSQADYPWLRVGDELYERQAYTDAETAYRKALEEKEKPTTSFNLGNTIYNQNRIPEAIQQYQKSIETSNDPALKSKAWYNMGNAHYQNQEYDKSIQAYIESLKLQPEDEEAKKNLTLALRQYQQQQQQQQQQEDQQKKEDQQQQQQQKTNNSLLINKKMNRNNRTHQTLHKKSHNLRRIKSNLPRS